MEYAHQKLLIMSAVLTGMIASVGRADTTTTTHDSKGNPIATFTAVQGPGSFGPAQKDPSGTLWSTYQGDFKFQINTTEWNQDHTPGVIVASEACDRIGGILPSYADYARLASYFEQEFNILTDQGESDLLKIFPDMGGRMYWTSTPDDSGTGGNLVFDSLYADSGNIGDLDYTQGVRCIPKP